MFCNVKGLEEPSKWSIIGDQIWRVRADLMALQETKLSILGEVWNYSIPLFRMLTVIIFGNKW